MGIIPISRALQVFSVANSRCPTVILQRIRLMPDLNCHFSLPAALAHLGQPCHQGCYLNLFMKGKGVNERGHPLAGTH